MYVRSWKSSRESKADIVSQLFFTDLGSGVPAPVHDTTADSEEEDAALRQPAAWEDSDDERLLVSLASVPRLRKLRRTEAEDVITGKDYIKRLRKQYVLCASHGMTS